LSNSHSNRRPLRIRKRISLFDTVAGLSNDILGHGYNGHLCSNAIALQGLQGAFYFHQFIENAATHSVIVAVVTIQEDAIRLQRQRVCGLGKN